MLAGRDWESHMGVDKWSKQAMIIKLNLLALLTTLTGQGAQVDQRPSTRGRERLDITKAASRHRISCPMIMSHLHMGLFEFLASQAFPSGFLSASEANL
jgi:hypothetical protein